MISPVIICGDKSEAAGRTRQGTFAPAQPCATRDSAQIEPTCVTGSLLFKTHCKPGAREVVTVRIRVGSGRAHRCIHRVPQAHELARIQFQSAHASRALMLGRHAYGLAAGAGQQAYQHEKVLADARNSKLAGLAAAVAGPQREG